MVDKTSELAFSLLLPAYSAGFKRNKRQRFGCQSATLLMNDN